MNLVIEKRKGKINVVLTDNYLADGVTRLQTMAEDTERWPDNTFFMVGISQMFVEQVPPLGRFIYSGEEFKRVVMDGPKCAGFDNHGVLHTFENGTLVQIA